MIGRIHRAKGSIAAPRMPNGITGQPCHFFLFIKESKERLLVQKGLSQITNPLPFGSHAPGVIVGVDEIAFFGKGADLLRIGASPRPDAMEEHHDASIRWTRHEILASP